MLVRSFVVKSIETGELYMIIDQVYEDYLLVRLSTGQIFKQKAYMIANDFLFERFTNGEEKNDNVLKKAFQKSVQ